MNIRDRHARENPKKIIKPGHNLAYPGGSIFDAKRGSDFSANQHFCQVGSFALESVAGLAWNTQPVYHGSRLQHESNYIQFSDHPAP
jgi:hypothetical protein